MQRLGAIVFAVAIVCCIGGCASTSGGEATQLKQTRQRVDGVMVRYHNRTAFGFITYEEKQQVEAAYKAYQTAFNQAVQQAHSDFTAPTPDNVKQLADRLYSLLDAIP